MNTPDTQSSPIETTSFAVAIEEPHPVGGVYKVRLCTGTRLDVPDSAVKNVSLIGRMGDDSGGEPLALLEIDDTTPAGRLVCQLAAEVERLTRPAEPLRDAGDSTTATGEPTAEGAFEQALEAPEPAAALRGHAQEIKFHCNGIACQPNFSNYNSDKNIVGHAFKRAEGCQFGGLTQIGPRTLRVTHHAFGGTKCGSAYNGRVWVDVAFAD